MESSEPFSSAHKTPTRTRFKSRGRFSTHRNHLGLRSNQSVSFKLPTQSGPLFVSEMSNPHVRNSVSVYDLFFRRPETHLVTVVE